MNAVDQSEKKRINPFAINSNAKYGFLYFDKNNNIPIRQWNGWYSVGGEKANRFNKISDLSIDVIWLTNLNKNECWKLGKYKKIKDSSFFGIDIMSIINENIIHNENNSEYCSIISETFSLIIDQMSFIFSEYNIELNFQDGNAYDLMRKITTNKDEMIDYSFEKIINSTYKENIKIQIPYDEIKGKKILKISKLRSVYFENIINNTNYPNGNWMPIGKDKLPDDNEKKKNFIEKNKEYPMLIHIEDISVKIGNKWSLKNEILLLLGNRFDDISKSAIWLTREEYELIKEKTTFKIKSIIVNNNYSKLDLSLFYNFLSHDVIFENTMTKQILTSVLFFSLSAKTRDGGNRKNFKITPKELWFKTADNIQMFETAKEFQKEGFVVIEYGNGEISMLYDEKIDINKLIKISEKNNMIVPTKILEYGNLIKNIDFKDERISDEEKNIIFNQWIQKIWLNKKENNLPISIILDRISYFLNGDEKLNKSQRIKDNLSILTSFLKKIPDDDFKNKFKELYVNQITKNVNKLKNLN